MVTYYDRKTLPAHKLIPQPLITFMSDPEQDAHDKVYSKLTLSAGGVETLSMTIYSQEEVRTIIKWGTSYRNKHCPISDEDEALLRKFVLLLRRFESRIDEGEN